MPSWPWSASCFSSSELATVSILVFMVLSMVPIDFLTVWRGLERLNRPILPGERAQNGCRGDGDRFECGEEIREMHPLRILWLAAGPWIEQRYLSADGNMLAARQGV